MEGKGLEFSITKLYWKDNYHIINDKFAGTDEPVKTSLGDKIEVMDASNSEEVKSEVSSLTSQLLTSMTEKMEVLDEMLIADQAETFIYVKMESLHGICAPWFF